MQLGPWGTITVTFNPPLSDGRLAHQIAQLRSQTKLHLLVDNGSRNVEELANLVASIDQGEGRTRLLRLDRNRGIGGAVNEAVEIFRKADLADWILLLDQDTRFYDESFRELHRELASIDEAGRIAVIGFNYVTHYFNRLGYRNASGGPKPLRVMITSGSLIRLSLLCSAPLDEGLFLHGTDTDYCYLVRRRGHVILGLRSAFIDHRESEQRVIGDSRRWYIEPDRLFYVTRNSFITFGRYSAVRPLLFALYLLFMNLVAHEEPLASVRYAWYGFSAFLKGERSGPMQR
jgi:GT2 family glycosyltransferase